MFKSIQTLTNGDILFFFEDSFHQFLEVRIANIHLDLHGLIGVLFKTLSKIEGPTGVQGD